MNARLTSGAPARQCSPIPYDLLGEPRSEPQPVNPRMGRSMTAAERASLERLEDKMDIHLGRIETKVDTKLDRIETKVDGLDGRLRAVELKAAASEGEKAGGRRVLTGGIQTTALIAACFGAVVGIPSAIWALGRL